LFKIKRPETLLKQSPGRTWFQKITQKKTVITIIADDIIICHFLIFASFSKKLPR